jgi:hypothetical protein
MTKPFNLWNGVVASVFDGSFSRDMKSLLRIFFGLALTK